MGSFKAFVEIGRVCVISHGKDFGKLVVIADVVDQNRVRDSWARRSRGRARGDSLLHRPLLLSRRPRTPALFRTRTRPQRGNTIGATSAPTVFPGGRAAQRRARGRDGEARSVLSASAIFALCRCRCYTARPAAAAAAGARVQTRGHQSHGHSRAHTQGREIPPSCGGVSPDKEEESITKTHRARRRPDPSHPPPAPPTQNNRPSATPPAWCAR
jgi:hypothetical protein